MAVLVATRAGLVVGAPRPRAADRARARRPRRGWRPRFSRIARWRPKPSSTPKPTRSARFSAPASPSSPPDGRVVGDSDLTIEQLRSRPRTTRQRRGDRGPRRGFGASQRHSATVGTDMEYVAIPVTQSPACRRLDRAAGAAAHRRGPAARARLRSLAALGFVVGTLAAVVPDARCSASRSRAGCAPSRIARAATRPAISRRRVPDYEQDEIGSVVADARRADARPRGAARRARGRSRAHGGDPLRHGRRRDRRQRARPPAARQRRGAPRCCTSTMRWRAGTIRRSCGIPPSPGQIAAALAGQPVASVELTGVGDPSQTLIARDGAGERRLRARRRRRLPRHQRPAPHRPDPPRFRRQRLARAAHAADRDPRLRRGARPTPRPRRAGASSRSSRATRCGWSG